MRIITTLIATLAATSAQAHPGHLTDLAGHNHWLGAGAIGLAIAIGLWKAAKDRKEAATDSAEGEAEPDAEPQEA